MWGSTPHAPTKRIAMNLTNPNRSVTIGKLDEYDQQYSCRNIYIGAGAVASDVAISSNLRSHLRYGKPVSVTCQGNKIWCLVPSSYSIQVYMSGFDIPVTVDTVTIDGKSYKAYSSRNTYTGTFNVSIS